MYECIVYKDHSTFTCPCYKYNNICKHSLCVSEKRRNFDRTLELSCPVTMVFSSIKSGLVEPAKNAQGKQGGAHKNPWRPSRSSAAQEHHFTEIHHNNLPLVVGFLDDHPNAKECRQCRVEFPWRRQIVPYDIILNNQEKWMYPSPGDLKRKLPWAQYATRYYCIKRSCITSCFPYFHSSFVDVPSDVISRLRQSSCQPATSGA